MALRRRPRRTTSGGAARFGRWTGYGFVLALAIYLAWGLIWSDRGYTAYRRELRHVQQLQAQVERLREERERLAREILRLRHDPKALEELAHRELGYVYPDEYMMILPEKERGVRREGSGVKGQRD